VHAQEIVQILHAVQDVLAHVKVPAQIIVQGPIVKDFVELIVLVLVLHQVVQGSAGPVVQALVPLQIVKEPVGPVMVANTYVQQLVVQVDVHYRTAYLVVVPRIVNPRVEIHVIFTASESVQVSVQTIVSERAPVQIVKESVGLVVLVIVQRSA